MTGIYLVAMLLSIPRYWDLLGFANQMIVLTFVEGTLVFSLLQLNLTLYKFETVNVINALLAYENFWNRRKSRYLKKNLFADIFRMHCFLNE